MCHTQYAYHRRNTGTLHIHAPIVHNMKIQMDFTPTEFWKNFRLGTELSISGNFIYNGLYNFDLMSHFYYEDEAFEFLYNISVRIE